MPKRKIRSRRVTVFERAIAFADLETVKCNTVVSQYRSTVPFFISDRPVNSVTPQSESDPSTCPDSSSHPCDALPGSVSPRNSLTSRVPGPSASVTMTSSAYYANSEADYWPYQSSIADRAAEQVMYPDSAYQASHQLHSSTDYSQRPGQQLSPPSSLLETLLRHGKEAIGEGYSNSGGKAVTPPSGQSIPHVPCQTPPYTPTSSTDRTSPIAGYSMEPQERGQQQESQSGYMQGYQGYSQPHSSNSVTPMMPSSPTEYGVQQGYGYVNNNNNGKQSPEANEYAEDQSQRQVDYPWMKSSYSNGL